MCQACETELDWGDHLITIHSVKSEIIKGFQRAINELKMKFNTIDVVLYFTSPENFRKKIDPEYKGKRTKRKPVGYKMLLDWAKENYPTRMVHGLEADDLLGIDCHLNPDPFVLISNDKDLAQISCRQYDGVVERDVPIEDADLFFYTQVLTGDQVDGYKGCPGVGPVKAQKILSKGEPWPAIVRAYTEAGLTEDDAIRNAQLARILRPEDYNFKTHQPILWTPSRD